MSFIPCIGLEFHVQLATKSKMFSCAANTYGETPNSHVSYNDIALPGAMPTVNKQAVIFAIQVANALHMNIASSLVFDRKHYFYSDLAKGYQITQEKYPLGRNGYLMVDNRSIGIERLHLEEDTCKQVHTDKETILDYNRAGIPLIEIVTKPDINSPLEAKKVVQLISQIVKELGASKGKLEEGSLRVDVNISLKEENSSIYGTKVEIKNINSFTNVKKALEYEIKRQKALLENGGSVAQETRRYDDAKKATVLMRIKEDDVDYKPLIDANIPPIELSKEFIDMAVSNANALIDDKIQKYISLGVKENDAYQIAKDKEKSLYYDRLLELGAPISLAASWINSYLQNVCNTMDSINLVKILKALEQKEITTKEAKELLSKLSDNCSIDVLLEQYKKSSFIKEDEIDIIIDDILKDNPNIIIEYQKGHDRILGYAVGQVLNSCKEKVDPSLVKSMVERKLKEGK